MTTETVLAARPSALDIDCAIHDVTYLVALAKWIEDARLCVEGVDSAYRSRDPAMRKGLDKYDIRTPGEWGDDESAGLHLVLSSIREKTAKLAVKHVGNASAPTLVRPGD